MIFLKQITKQTISYKKTRGGREEKTRDERKEKRRKRKEERRRERKYQIVLLPVPPKIKRTRYNPPC